MPPSRAVSDSDNLHRPDPFDWSVEQVTHALCDPYSDLLSSEHSVRIPDPQTLANILREQEINGRALLSIQDQSTLRDDLGIRAYGHRLNLLHLIEKLQQVSSKYRQREEQLSSFAVPSSRGFSRQNTPFWLGSPPLPHPECFPPLFGQSPTSASVAERFPLTPQGNLRNPTASDAQSPLNIAALLDGPRREDKPCETVIVDENGRKKRRLVLGPQNLVSTIPAPAPPTNSETAPELPQSPVSEVIASEAVPSRIIPPVAGPSEALDAGDSSRDPIDPHSYVPEEFSDAVDCVNETDEPLQENAIEIPSGRKKIKPILISEPFLDEKAEQGGLETQPLDPAQPTLEASTQQISRKGYRRAKDVYLGPLASPVDQTFYGNVAMEGKLPDLDDNDVDDDFCHLSAADRARGHCLYVGSLMKHFLRAERLDFSKPGRKIVGVVPYSDRLSRKNHPLSMTIFSSDNNVISVSRANRHRWTAIPNPNTEGETAPSDVFHVAEPGLAMDSADDQNWTSLEKWKYIDNDYILRTYGDSGSEGEYDMDTWNEMEREGGKLKRPKLKSRGRQIPHDEVEKVINDAITSYRQEWQTKKRPTFLPKAWRFWARAKKDGVTQEQVAAFADEIKRLQVRIEKLHKEISKEQWTQVAHLTAQCKILQPSVFDQEEKEWRRGVLQLDRAPAKPPKQSEKSEKPAKPRQAVSDPTALGEDEEVLESSYDHTDDESDDSLADFVVDDETETDCGSAPMVLDHDEQTMGDDEEGAESDTLVDPPVKEEPAKAKDPMNRSSQSPSAADYIDLTQASDPKSTPATNQIAEAARTTPPAPQPSEEEEGNKIRTPMSQRRRQFRIPPPVIRDQPHEVITIDSDSEPPKVPWPALDDVKGIFQLTRKEAQVLVERQDRKRLLLWVVAHCKRHIRKSTFDYFRSVPLPDCQADVMRGLNALLENHTELGGIDKETSDNILQIATWFISWTIPTKPEKRGLNVSDVGTTISSIEDFAQFYEFLIDNIPLFETQLSGKVKNSLSRQQRQQSSSKEDSNLSDSSGGDRKIFATESQATVDRRGLAMQRLREDEQRKKMRERQEQKRREQLKGRLSATSTKPGNRSNVTVNPGKLDEQEFIYLNPQFGQGMPLKTHQEEGLQFLWRELTTDHTDLQGCLLAQAMGLGKTIQVIALLVALMDAARSKKKNIRDQVPVALQKSQTLILCPVTLIENWWDELLLWTPQPNHLGPIRKVSAALKLPERVAEIKAWSEGGGILLLGFPTFRELIHNKAKVGRKVTVPSALDSDQHMAIRAALLEKPALVVADEAHEIKNETSLINEAFRQINCKSRIALTGSPLSNNLKEYYALIDWIAPGYLGQYKEFKATFEDPIYAGGWQDSSPYERKESRKRLKTLELELEPKVHRADATALHNILHGKVEYIIKVPLTPVQRTLYCNHIDCLTGVSASIEPRKSSLWAYIGALQLLCNHPKPYYEQLLEDANTSQIESGQKVPGAGTKFDKSSNGHSNQLESSSSDEPDPVYENVAAQSVPGTLKAAQEVVGKLVEGIESLSHSYKMTALVEIVRLSIAAKDKVLIFSHRVATLEYVGEQLAKRGIKFVRIAAEIPPTKRQETTKMFNEGSASVCVISTRVGGQGLNLFSANRVIILDEGFNPMWEQQAVGRAYRLGQKKRVYVYRLTVAGTFEQEIQKQSRFKEQLATRVVDKKNPVRRAQRGPNEYLFSPKQVAQEDLSQYRDKDKSVLSHLLANPKLTPILSITPFETFYVEEVEELTDQDLLEVKQMQRDEQLRRQDIDKYNAMMEHRRWQNVRSSYAPPASHFPGPGVYNTGHPMAVPNTMPQPTTFATPGPPSTLSRHSQPHPQAAPLVPAATAANDHRPVLEPVLGGNTRTSSISPQMEHSNMEHGIFQAHNKRPDAPLQARTPPNGLPNTPLELPVRASGQKAVTLAPSLSESRQSALKSVEEFLGHWTRADPKDARRNANPAVVHGESELRLEKSINHRLQRDPFSHEEPQLLLTRIKILVIYYAQDTHDYYRLASEIIALLTNDHISVEDVLDELEKGQQSQTVPPNGKRSRHSSGLESSVKKQKTSAVLSPKIASSNSTNRMFAGLLIREANRNPTTK